MSNPNPYVNGGVIWNDAQFYDRKQLIEELLSSPNSSTYYIKGNRRIGKTSLLRSIERQLLAKTNCLPIYLNLDGAISNYDIGNYFKRELKKVTQHLSNPAPSFSEDVDFIEALISWIQYGVQHKLHCFLLLDEAEQLLHLSDNDLAKLHRELVNTHDNLSVIMTATGRLQELFQRQMGSVNFLDNFTTKHIGCLPEEYARNLVCQIMLEEQHRPIVKEKILLDIIRYAGHHPFLLQRLCYQLCKNGILRKINETDLAIDKELDHFLNVDFDHLDEDQQKILLQFNWEIPLTRNEIKGPSQHSIQSALIELEKLGFLKANQQQYSLSNYFLAQWLEKRKIQGKQKIKQVKIPLIFLSYSHEDSDWKNKLRKQLSILERKGILQVWEDTHLLPGQEWNKEIEKQLDLADIFLFLVSADLLASKFVMDIELPTALDRFQKGEAKVIPIIMRSCLWKESDFSKFQALPKDGKPVKSFADEDEVLSEIGKRLRELAKL